MNDGATKCTLPSFSSPGPGVNLEPRLIASAVAQAFNEALAIANFTLDPGLEEDFKVDGDNRGFFFSGLLQVSEKEDAYLYLPKLRKFLRGLLFIQTHRLVERLSAQMPQWQAREEAYATTAVSPELWPGIIRLICAELVVMLSARRVFLKYYDEKTQSNEMTLVAWQVTGEDVRMKQWTDDESSFIANTMLVRYEREALVRKHLAKAKEKGLQPGHTSPTKAFSF